MLIIHIITKGNDSANIILLFTVNDQISILFNLSPLGSAIILKLLVNKTISKLFEIFI